MEQQLPDRGRADSHLQAVDVVIVSPSVAGWLDRRTRLREQLPRNMMLAPDNTSSILKFAIGNLSLNGVVDSIQSEQATHSDLLFFDDCLDSDDALNVLSNWNLHAGSSSTTCKVRKSVAWAVMTYDFKYFFRLGDDSYLRIDKFLDMFVQKQLLSGKVVIGQILQTPIFGMLQEYPQGMGYAITYPICEFIKVASPWLLDTAPEDGVLARWLFAVGAQFVNSTAWRNMDSGPPCDDEMVLVHKLPDDQWLSITPSGLLACQT